MTTKQKAKTVQHLCNLGTMAAHEIVRLFDFGLDRLGATKRHRTSDPNFYILDCTRTGGGSVICL